MKPRKRWIQASLNLLLILGVLSLMTWMPPSVLIMKVLYQTINPAAWLLTVVFTLFTVNTNLWINFYQIFLLRHSNSVAEDIWLFRLLCCPHMCVCVLGREILAVNFNPITVGIRPSTTKKQAMSFPSLRCEFSSNSLWLQST